MHSPPSSKDFFSSKKKKMEDDPARRPKRQCARAARAVTALPSVAHYVGYVEDNETPEQIMKKFETMEKVKDVTRRGARCDSCAFPSRSRRRSSFPLTQPH